MHRHCEAALVTTAFSCRPVLRSRVAINSGFVGSRFPLGHRHLDCKRDVAVPMTPHRALQGGSFACLPQLRTLRIEAEVSAAEDAFAFDDEGVHVSLAGLPAGLETLEVWTACISTAYVRSEQKGYHTMLVRPCDKYHLPCLCLPMATPPAALASTMLCADVPTGADVEHGGRVGG